ncbi:bifunctional 3-dehydroquinate dehydratase/shikimate dehydrogenase, chloroplastic-like isoform X2 [Salvia miltiorrhiza]|uniref:bifunctional 3-dehydroquinate dehydratase/shikimate dehydrogenase, chloroplastic-like isoform X2 n=1 Tax=Salvia miltiorrhiza TaxID=226208 RepID=UPI0025AD23BF|nr:bifunctional 3-dehydroquinate dehydratase/shikimate dehydrogenase, chloroplastic-like isoform X2 [Salvia miltiorrhiza]
MVRVGVSDNSRLICAALPPDQSVDQLLNGMHQAMAQGADLVQIALDCVSDSDLTILLRNNPIPVVLVSRPKWEGRVCKSHLQSLLLAKDLGADYIDLELKAASALIKEDKFHQLKSSKIIVSTYLDSFTALLEDPSLLVAEMKSTEADVIKFVWEAANITEVATAFDLLSNSQVPMIAHCTGERGLISQLLSFKFGGLFAYGSIEGNTVPGLPSVAILRQAYGLKNINKGTQVFGLISKPVSHSKGPLLHNPTFRHAGYNGIYVPMFVDNLKEFFSVYTSPDFAGFSVGIPYKEAVIDFCDEVHPVAQSIGAVNTVVRRRDDGKLVGYNTDCEAAIVAMEDALKSTDGLNGKQFVLVGAGGAGRALAFGAKIRGARVVIFDIDLGRAKSLAAAVSAEALPFDDLLAFRPEKDAILANATPLGMHPHVERRIPVLPETLRDYKLVFDAVYNPRKTRLLKEAEAAGAIVVSGVEMFLRQAAAQFSLFTGNKAPEDFMRGIIMEKF